MDVREIQRRMVTMEEAVDQRAVDGVNPSYGEVAATLLGIEPSDAFDNALAAEAQRAVRLAYQAAVANGLAPTRDLVASIAFVQGVTFAVAAHEERAAQA